MPHAIASASAVIDAPAARVYQILADYRQHHPRIAPPEYFRKIEVEEGGVGAGTRTLVEMKVLGTTRRFTQVIREPEPGRILEEAVPDGSSTTTFKVDPLGQGTRSRVTIHTTFAVRGGILGTIEGAVGRAMLGRIYRKELSRLGEYARALR